MREKRKGRSASAAIEGCGAANYNSRQPPRQRMRSADRRAPPRRACERALIGGTRRPSGPHPAPPRRCLPGARRAARGARSGGGARTGTGTGAAPRPGAAPPAAGASAPGSPVPPSASRYRAEPRRPHHDEVSVPAAGRRAAPRAAPPRPLRLQQGADRTGGGTPGLRRREEAVP